MFNIFNLIIIFAAFINRCKQYYRTNFASKNVIERKILEISIAQKNGSVRELGPNPVGTWITLTNIIKHHGFDPACGDDFMRITFAENTCEKNMIVTMKNSAFFRYIYFEIPASQPIPKTPMMPKSVELDSCVFNYEESELSGTFDIEEYMVSDTEFAIDTGDFCYKHIFGNVAQKIILEDGKVIEVSPETPISPEHIS